MAFPVYILASGDKVKTKEQGSLPSNHEKDRETDTKRETDKQRDDSTSRLKKKRKK